MDCISSKEFLKQSEKVKKALIEWWEPKYFDLIYYERGNTFCGSNSFDNTVDIFDWNGKERNWIDKDKVIPLLTETQLRKFIEGNTGCKIDVNYYKNSGYDFYLYKQGNVYAFKTFLDLGEDLLQAYWQVAIKIAEGE